MQCPPVFFVYEVRLSHTKVGAKLHIYLFIYLYSKRNDCFTKEQWEVVLNSLRSM